ncbi:3-deoxy-D-manno-octulosonic acid transferase [Sagittula sp. NFXS13]|uniref:3-deoxy-D-manno-octulosonic acid transferase n=1 Tax=Sagittula sp. NFXS13 TaxID=2819095 RepID=UPI0032DF187A
MLRYRCLISLFAIVVLLRHGMSRLRVPKGRPGAHIWLHGASNGELNSVRPVLERLVEERPETQWLVTANTETGRKMVAGWGLPRVHARLAPLDLGWLTRRVLRDWTVTAHLTLESEVWPHRVLFCGGPVLILGARMTPGTARGWARLGNLAKRVFGRVTFASAQDAGSAKRLKGLGVPAEAEGPVVDLKAFYSAPEVAPVEGVERGRTWLAASTHPGEEAVVLAAHKMARILEPELRLILAPRHPRRASEIRAMIAAEGFTVGQRSAGDTPATGEVYLADTMGEMALWYAACGRVFVAGTLTDRGGHTPYEPAAYGASLIHGPDVRNFATAYARLDEAGAAQKVTDAASLAQALEKLGDPTTQARAGRRAKALLRPQVGPEALCAMVLDALPHP